jgi:large subunit ribosomal protein L2
MKHYAPSTPSRRQTKSINYREVLSGAAPYKPLLIGSRRRAGRNNRGRITVRHQGGGHKRRWRLVDFVYNKHDIPAKMETIEYDPHRSAFIGLVCYADGERRYHVVPSSFRPGSSMLVSATAPIEPGNRLPLSKIPVGTPVFNIEVKPSSGAKLVRSAGVMAEVLSHDGGYTTVKLPSTEVRKIKTTAWASIGQVGNEEARLVVLGKAGRSRWKGIRPTVRGSAMNPVDHPYGGGEGRQGRGTRRPKTRWGKPTGGVKTRRPKKYSNNLIVTRRVKKGRKR